MLWKFYHLLSIVVVMLWKFYHLLSGTLLQLRTLAYEELEQRLSDLDPEMEREIEELRARYQAKRQPIQEAIDAKKKRQQNFWTKTVMTLTKEEMQKTTQKQEWLISSGKGCRACELGLDLRVEFMKWNYTWGWSFWTGTIPEGGVFELELDLRAEFLTGV